MAYVPGPAGCDRRTHSTPASDFIRRVRLALGLSQRAFGALLEVTPMTVIRWESGRTRPQPGNLERIRRLLATRPVQEMLDEAQVLPLAPARSPAPVPPGGPHGLTTA